MKTKKTRVVILGSGFAGIQTALELLKRGDLSEYEIILISNRTVVVYNADLYEIATAYYEKITDKCLTELKKSVAIPLERIFQNQDLHFIHDTVTKIVPEENRIELKDKRTISYHILVIALGSVTNYYDIEGLRQFSYPLKTLQDALSISCHLDTYFQNLWKKETKKNVRIVIGGGGFTGVEFACELPGFLKKLCKKYHYPFASIVLSLIEAGQSLGGSGQDEKIAKIIEKRLRIFGYEIHLNTKIQQVEANKITTDKGDIEMDMLMWTGGVKPHPIIAESFKNVAKNGGLPVSEYLQNPDFPNIYGAGDCAYIADPETQKPLPMLAQLAIQEGKTIAENILAGKNNTPKKIFESKIKGIIIPLGGKFATCKLGKKVYSGFWCWALKRLGDLKYSLSVLPFFSAVKKWIHSTNIFVENDE